MVKTGKAVLGWAALSQVSRRPCYSCVAEVSVYVAAAASDRGIGKALLDSLVAASEKAGIWTLHASIFPENEAGIALHRSCGFAGSRNGGGGSALVLYLVSGVTRWCRSAAAK